MPSKPIANTHLTPRLSATQPKPPAGRPAADSAAQEGRVLRRVQHQAQVRVRRARYTAPRDLRDSQGGAYARPSPTRCPIATTPRTPQSRSTSAWTSSRGEPGALPRGRRSGKPPAGADGGLKQRNPGIAQTLFRSGMIEQYGTGIPRIKRYCDAEGVKFSYRQTANTTVIRFDRPGTQVSIEKNASMPKHIGAAKYEILDEAERIAITFATERGRATRRELSETAGIGKMKAVQTLKTLASKGALIWMGKSQNDPISIIVSSATTRFAVRYCPLLSSR